MGALMDQRVPAGREDLPSGTRARLSPQELEAAERAGRNTEFDAVVENVLQEADVPARSAKTPEP